MNYRVFCSEGRWGVWQCIGTQIQFRFLWAIAADEVDDAKRLCVSLNRLV